MPNLRDESTLVRTASPSNPFPYRRTLLLAFLVCFVLVADFLLVTNVIFDPSRPALLGVSYDDLGASLLRGKATVRLSSICWEYFFVDGQVFMYFAPFPALLRILPNALFPEMYGHWSRWSSFLAAVIGQLAFLWMLLRTIGASERWRRGRGDAMIATLFLGFCFGTPYPFLLTAPGIYQESVLWAYGLSIAAICSLAAPRHLERKHVLVFAAAAGGAFLSKATFGFPLYLLAGGLFLAGLPLAPRSVARLSPELGGLRAGSTAGWIAAFLPVVACGLLYAAYNYERFGSPFAFIDFSYRQTGNSNSVRFVAEHGAFTLARIPVLVEYYFLSLFDLHSEPPFIGYTYLSPAQRADALLMNRTPMLSLLPGCAWLVFIGAWGLGFVVSRARRHLLFSAMALLLFVQVAVILSYYVVSLRYAMEILPLFVFGTTVALRGIAARGPAHTRSLACGVVALAVGQAVWTQTAVAYQHVADPRAASFRVDDKRELLDVLGSGVGPDKRIVRFRRLSCPPAPTDLSM